jgi:uncharacterized iron-regulated membrane protein
MQKISATWIPSIVFGTGIVVATAVSIYAPVSVWYGVCAALIYAIALAVGGLIEQRRSPALNAPNRTLTKYAAVSLLVLLVAAVFAPGWLPGLIPAFGVEGFALLRQSPRCATKTFKELWQRVRKT